VSTPPPADEQLPLFVYGTLRPGQINHRLFLLGRTVRERPAVLLGHRMYALDYPCIVDDSDGGRVVGHLIEIRAEEYAATLAAIDGLEGYRADDADSPYVRVRRTAQVADAGDPRATEVWVYLAGPPVRARLADYESVPGGDWLAYPGAERYGE
jgi:gamma-glutamylcyclotransferase (GGCT)/AIG2-like uncharacterized protein YtfP